MRGGAYASKGMVSFSHVLDSEQSAAVHAYLIKRAHDAKEERALLAAGAVAPGEASGN